MLIRLVSDLHCEFGMFDLPELPEDKDTVLILAGDIGVVKRMKSTILTYLDEYAERFKDVIYIMGNHESYKGSVTNSLQKVQDAISHDNVHVLENDVVTIDDVAFVCATMWASYDNANPMTILEAETGMNDHKIIRCGKNIDDAYHYKFKAHDAYSLFLQSKDFIFDAIDIEKTLNRKICVVTHHAPSFKSIAEEFKGNKLNGVYASQLDEDIINTRPDVWIHGHVHLSFDYMIENTRVLCNPRGYARIKLNPDFNPRLRIDL